jgi:type III secretory pathway component EscR
MATAPIGSSKPVQNAKVSSEPKLSSSEITSKWNNLVDSVLKYKSDEEGAKTLESKLGATGTKKFKEKMDKDLKEFLSKNPNATEKDVQEFFSKQSSKNSSYELVTKMQMDNFFSKILQKAKESQSDRWG